MLIFFPLSLRDKTVIERNIDKISEKKLCFFSYIFWSNYDSWSIQYLPYFEVDTEQA
jgi:hypothetical protein